MRELLKQHFGFDEFLPLQEEIIATFLEERDALFRFLLARQATLWKP